MNIVNIPLSEIIPYENNPRNNDTAVDYVANSIKEFGFKSPIIIDKDNVIVCGHTRARAAEKLGLTTVPCIIADDLTDEQVKAYRLADNKTAEYAEWDFTALQAELDELSMDFDMSDFGFDMAEQTAQEINDTEDTKYTKKTDIPQYQPTGEKVEISELVNQSKTKELLEKINSSGISDEQKMFLTNAAQRHQIFNYRKIAEYYSNTSKEMQELMEQSALVLIDYDNAIKNGYTKFVEELEDVDKR